MRLISITQIFKDIKMKYHGLPFSKTGWDLHMMPIGYLMIEHRLIERMIKLINGQLNRIDRENKADLVFIDTAIDFIRAYADKCHHGKEEDILFERLSKKPLIPEHKKAMQMLLEEHKMGRLAVGKLIDAKDKYSQGNSGSLKAIRRHLKWLVEFYPEHIAKEDKGFFIPSMQYFSKQEQDSMLIDFCKFDGPEIQQVYRKIVQGLEA